MLPNREASKKHWLTLSAPPSTSISKSPSTASADTLAPHPGSNELENSVRGKHAASNASVKSFPVIWLSARSRKDLKAAIWSCTSMTVTWCSPLGFLNPLGRAWDPMHLRAHSVNFCTFVLASAFRTSSPWHSCRRSFSLKK